MRKKRKGNETRREETKKLGTVLGVFFPCVQNIFGVILFIRMVWIVGTAGWVQAFSLVFMCCCCTLTTAISMSAIATNGVMSSGGSYFMISRALGPEFGGAVGFLFYLGTTVASSMYIVGAVEILLQYIAPSLSVFGPVTEPENAYNCYRLYGSCLLLFVFFCVFIGVRFVSKFSPLALVCVLGSIACVYVGIFTANKHAEPRLCFLGDRLLAAEKIFNNQTGTLDCSKNISGPIHTMYCGGLQHDDGPIADEDQNGVVKIAEEEDDDDCDYFRKHDATWKAGMPGLTSGLFFKNMWSKYSEKGNRVGKREVGDRKKGDIVADITTSFVVLIGIFFPSVTGIMAGSNRSGDLEDAQKSIPVGTLGAVAFTSTIYLSSLLCFAATVEGDLLRDKIGESIGGGLIVAHLAWPNPWVITVGSFLSTFGAGLQSLVGAPRLLQAIAKDGIIPFLDPFAVTSAKGEPIRALFLTGFIAELGVLLANVDLIAPITTMFFLMCYCFTNLACAVQTILRTPNWRPRFKFYHWALSMFGVLLCLSLMFMSSWIYTIAALSLAAFIYKYIEFKGAEKEWGDGIRGLSMSAARFALLRLEEGAVHVKNFRPQLLILLKLDNQLLPKYRKLLTFAAQLKAGRGLTLVASVLEGDDLSSGEFVEVARRNVHEVMKKEKAKGFFEVLVAKDRAEGMSFFIQAAGLGGLRHNTVLLNWPLRWRKHPNRNRIFVDTLRTISDRHLAALIMKNIDLFPDNCDKVSGFIDVWWIVHDGGLLMLLPFLLTQHKVWKYCKLRIFTVAQLDDNSMQIRKDLEKFMYQLRIPAQVHVVEMEDKDIRTYAHLKSMSIERRPQSMPTNVVPNDTCSSRSSNKTSVKHYTDIRVHQSMSMPGPVCASETSCPIAKGQRNQVKFSASGHTRLGRSRESTLNTDDDDDDDFSVSVAHSDTMATLDPHTLAIVEEQNSRRLRTAIRLNEIMTERSKDARLILLNLPALPSKHVRHHNYMEFLEALTRNMERVMMVRGGGSEVITIFS